MTSCSPTQAEASRRGRDQCEFESRHEEQSPHSPVAEAVDLKSTQRGFESHCGEKAVINSNGKGRWTHCVYGHEFTPENTRVLKSGKSAGKRICRECAKRRSRKDNRNFLERHPELRQRRGLKRLSKSMAKGTFRTANPSRPQRNTKVTHGPNSIVEDSLDRDVSGGLGYTLYSILASPIPSPLEELIQKEEWEEERKYHDWERRWNESPTYLYRPNNDNARVERHQKRGKI